MIGIFNLLSLCDCVKPFPLLSHSPVPTPTVVPEDRNYWHKRALELTQSLGKKKQGIEYMIEALKNI